MDLPSSSSGAAVRSTDLDALQSRISCASLGYTTDPFSPLFLPRPPSRSSTQQQPGRKPALINIGTHARVWAVDALVRRFLEREEEAGERQVVSLGAGTDSRYWRFRAACQAEGRPWKIKRWVEVDYPEQTSGKARAIAKQQGLKGVWQEAPKIAQGGMALHCEDYSLLPFDLAELFSDTSTSSEIGSQLDLDPSLPTLLLTECVLVYLPVEVTSKILSWCAGTFAASEAVSYDPFGLNDSFGKVMLRNLASRGLSLPAAACTPTLSSLNQRLVDAGFTTAESWTIKQLREGAGPGGVPVAEIERVNAIERLDEVEELNLVLEHYAVSWAALGRS